MLGAGFKNNLKKMIHTRLLGILRTINPLIPTDATPEQAWQMVKPEGRAFLRGSFWQVLSTLPFARTPEKQVKIADWIWRQKERAQKSGRQFPPKPIAIKPALLPQPHTA